MLDSLDKNLCADDFNYLSQEFDSKVLDLVKQKRFCDYNIWVTLHNLNKNCLAKKGLVVCWQVIKLVTLRIWACFKGLG